MARHLAAVPRMDGFGVDHAGIIDRHGYSIEEHGKPPDFVLEVASVTTGQGDYTRKRDDYAAFGVPEYWRFDLSRAAGLRASRRRVWPPLGGPERVHSGLWTGAAEALHWPAVRVKRASEFLGEVRAITRPERRLVIRCSVLTQ